MKRQYAKLISLSFVVVLIAAGQAHAYIGPGAGFAVVGSFLAMFTALFSAFLALFTWPLRYLIRAVRRRRAFAHARIKRFVILGLDGMDPGLTERFIAEGKLPNLAKLRENGCFKRLATTVPSMSPVAWSSFQTGCNPGKHNIFDFLTRDPKTYLPKLSSVDIFAPRRRIILGKLQIPLGRPDVRLLRKGKPFWKTLGEHGIFSSVIRVPITFPPEKFYGVELSGMCVPDLRGTQGMFSFYTTDKVAAEHTGGERFRVTRNNGRIRGELIGCANPMRRDGAALKCPFFVTLEGAYEAQLRIGGQTLHLEKNHYSDWVRVPFKAAPGVKVTGICRFLLKSIEPHFGLYVTPINIDPGKPAMPISYPGVFATYLAKSQGPFATLGLAEDSWALNEDVIDDGAFVEQCVQGDIEREKMFLDALDKVRQGLVVCVFDGTDRLQHTFWRQIDPEHPANKERKPSAERTVIEQLYIRMDELVGRTMARCNDKGTVFMIISDHGFNAFRYGVDLNRWLENEGYLSLKSAAARDEKNLAAVDLSRTRAYAIGLAGIFLNLKGREANGIVEPGAEAERLREEIAGKLVELVDSERGQPAIKQVYNSMKFFSGPYKENAPDLIVGYNRGYRASWQTAIGQVTDRVFHDNTKAWSGDHCIDASFVPGVLFCSRPVATENPKLMDIGPTVLDMFGIAVPANMDGKAMAIAEL